MTMMAKTIRWQRGAYDRDGDGGLATAAAMVVINIDGCRDDGDRLIVIVMVGGDR